MTKFYQVGGSVRDELMGLKSKDIDYAVEAGSYSEMRDEILDRGGEIFLETPQFLTIRAKVPGLGACDFVLCRKDGAYSDGRHPEKVEVGTIYDDLARRDFTVNAIAKGEDGILLDPHSGVKDLNDKVLRCVGDPIERFTEDGLRILRAIRFSLTKGLVMDYTIDVLLHLSVFTDKRLAPISVERIYDELGKCFRFSTLATLEVLTRYKNIRDFIFKDDRIWLKPTLEER